MDCNGTHRSTVGNLAQFLPAEVPYAQAAVFAGGKQLPGPFAERSQGNDPCGRLPLRGIWSLGQLVGRKVEMSSGQNADDPVRAADGDPGALLKQREAERLGGQGDPGRLGGVLQMHTCHGLVI